MESKTQRTKSEQRGTTVCHYFGTTGRKREKNHAHYKTPTKAKEKGVHLFAADTRRGRIKRPVHFARKKSQ